MDFTLQGVQEQKENPGDPLLWFSKSLASQMCGLSSVQSCGSSYTDGLQFSETLSERDVSIPYCLEPEVGLQYFGSAVLSTWFPFQKHFDNSVEIFERD